MLERETPWAGAESASGVRWRTTWRLLWTGLLICLPTGLSLADDATFRLTLQPGWNLIAVPIRPLPDAPTDVLGPTVVSPAWEWTDAAYRPADRIVPGRGYWVFSLSTHPVERVLQGRLPRTTFGSLAPDWNLLGGIGDGTAALLPLPLLTDPADACGPMVWVWRRDHHEPGTTLPPGDAAWAFANAPADALLSPNPWFEGVRLATSSAPGQLDVQWDAAVDDRTAAAGLRYHVHVAADDGTGAEILVPDTLAATAWGDLQASVGGLLPGQRYAVGVLCEDGAGLRNWLGRDAVSLQLPETPLTASHPVIDLAALGIGIVSAVPGTSEVVVDDGSALASGDMIVFDSAAGRGLKRITGLTPDPEGTRLLLDDAALADAAGGGVLATSMRIADGGEGKVLLAPGASLRYDLDAHGAVAVTADFRPLRSRQLRVGFAGRLRGSIGLTLTEAGSATATRRLLGASRLAGFSIDGIPIRQEVGLDVEARIVTAAAGPVDLALQQDVDLDLDTSLTCTDGTWNEQTSTAATPLATFSLQTEDGVTAEVSVALTVWTRFYGEPVGRAIATLETSLVAETAAGPPHAFTRLDVQSTVTERTEAGPDVLLAGHCAPWQGSEQVVLQETSFSLPEVRFLAPPAVVYPGVPAAFQVEIVDGVGNPVDESSIVWELDPSDPGSAAAELEVAPDRRQAVVRTHGAGTWELRCRLHGHGLPTAAGTQVAATRLAAPALIALALDPPAPEAVPGESLELRFTATYSDAHQVVLGSGVTVEVYPADHVVVADQTLHVDAEAPGGTLRLTARWGGVESEAVLRIVADGDAEYLIVHLGGARGSPFYPVTYANSLPAPLPEAYKSTKLLLRRIPAATFAMGSPQGELGRESDEAVHAVTITRAFYVGVFEVTQAQWQLVMGDNPAYFPGDTRPVELVSYSDIRGAGDAYLWPGSTSVAPDSFIGRLRQRAGLPGWDLPTEAQWEHACRAGTGTALNTGVDLEAPSQSTAMDEAGRYWYNGGSDYAADPLLGAHAPVGSYLPNAWGIHDLHGNVAEWCLDWYGLYAGASTDPGGPTTGPGRVIRGGSWADPARSCRSATRWYETPTMRSDAIGLRLVVNPL